MSPCIPLMLGLGVRMSYPYVYVIFWASNGMGRMTKATSMVAPVFLTGATHVNLIGSRTSSLPAHLPSLGSQLGPVPIERKPQQNFISSWSSELLLRNLISVARIQTPYPLLCSSWGLCLASQTYKVTPCIQPLSQNAEISH